MNAMEEPSSTTQMEKDLKAFGKMGRNTVTDVMSGLTEHHIGSSTMTERSRVKEQLMELKLPLTNSRKITPIWLRNPMEPRDP